MSRRGIDIGDAAISILQGRSGAGNIEECTAAISHLQGTKVELLEALAYTAAQVYAYRQIANEDAALALRNIEKIVADYRSRRPA